MARDLETIIRISGNLDASLRRVIEQASERIEQMDEAARQSADAIDAMSDTLSDQRDELKRAQKAYANYILKGEESTEQAQELADEIQRLSRDIKQNRSTLDAAERAAQQLADGFDDAEDSADDLGDAARGTKGDFTIMKGAIADLISDGIQKLIGAGANAVSSLYGLADSTREFRQDMGTLETSFDSAGFAADAATDTWRDLYAIFGEDDRAVEAANNIARMAENQQDLDKWVRITTGIWGTYQDALPVEGLAEAAGETAKVGKVTGVFADALNWSSEAAAMFADCMSEDVLTAEDAFNEALAECTTEAERNALITDTLTKLYGKAADKYDETAGSLMDANKATADLTLAQAEMGERIEPVTTAVSEGFAKVVTKALELTEDIDFEAFSSTVGKAFESAAKAMEKIPKAIDWTKRNAEILIPIVGGLTAAFAAYKAISMGAAAAEAVKTAVIASGSATMSAATIATWAFNSAVAFLTSPVTIAVAAIAALTAGTIWLYRNWDTAKEKLLDFGAKVNEVWSNISTWVTGAIDTIGQHFPIFGGYLSGWWSSIQDAVSNVQAIFGGLIDFISNVFSGSWSAAWKNVVDIFGNIFGMIGNIAKAPLNGVVSALNAVINGINGAGFTIPDWVPVVGGKSFSINIPNIPMLAEGGFTDGVSIAGEAGTEAVISFDRSVREANLGYWAKAGQLLGATADDAGFFLSGDAGGSTVIDMGGVTFAPNINVSGKAEKESVIKAIEDEYPEFLDMLENWLLERGVTVYA